ncbi:MAG: hypothetical protein H7061_08620 [Bdellovibrionaceae bacterium]|nr:hypothetical protein [Bdellovibrio sp.]
MKTIYTSLLSISLASPAFAATSHYSVECVASSTVEMNRFNLAGFVDISDKGQARAEIKVNSQMAGKDAPLTDYGDLSEIGTARTYPAKSLGLNEVTLIRLKTQSNGRTLHLTIASGLLGPQSTLVVNTTPFRAECKLGSFLK